MSAGCGRVGGDDGALALQVGLVEQLVELARLVNAAGDEQGVAAPALQPVARLHVHQDVGDDLLQPRLAGQHLLHRAPALLELRLGQIGQALGLGLEPLVDLRLRGDALVDVPRLVAQIQHHPVLHRLVELVGVDVAAEDLDALLLVRLQQRRAGEADEHRARQDGLHRLVQLAGLGAVALVHEDEQVALGPEVRAAAPSSSPRCNPAMSPPRRRPPCRRTCGSASRPATAWWR